MALWSKWELQLHQHEDPAIYQATALVRFGVMQNHPMDQGRELQSHV